MNISYCWLKQYVDCGHSPDELAQILTSVGLEVEGLHLRETFRGGLHGVVVGQVLTCQKHPDADKLSLTTVDVGNGEPLHIVCGAPNVRAGLKVLCATVGTKLYHDDEVLTIKKQKIRGQLSQGMLCAEDELGVGESHAGIMELPSDTPVGITARQFFDIQDDYLFEIGLTPNRIDAASHFGVARDLVAYLNSTGIPAKAMLPSVEGFKVDNTTKPISVEVVDNQACTRYAGLTISGVEVKPSPGWLQNRLRAIGLNPINNVVDVTNFVLHEIGQPLHAFDADKITGNCVRVQTMPEGTLFVTLDGVQRTLSDHDLMICNAREPMCIAGVLGGQESGVSHSTTTVFIESACFNPVYVRKTARRHGISTDASFRFERGVDPNITIWAIKRAAMLIQEVAGGQVSSQIVDVYPQPVDKFRVNFNTNRAARLIGIEIPANTLETILAGLEIEIEEKNGPDWLLRVPTYRVDVTREVDVVEEILRIYGYNHVPTPTKVCSSMGSLGNEHQQQMQNVVAQYLSSNRFNEIMCNSLSKAAYYANLATYPPSASVKILNPLSTDLNVMRQTLLFGGLESILRNINFRCADLKFYEFGHCYRLDSQVVDASAKSTQENHLGHYKEDARIALWLTGLASPEHWAAKAENVSFYHLKGFVNAILQRLGIDLDRLTVVESPTDVFAYGLSYMLNNQHLADLGMLHPDLLDTFDIKQEVFFAEIAWDLLLRQIRHKTLTYRELPKFPEVRRDLALMVDNAVRYEQIRSLALRTETKLLKAVNLFDVYRGDKLPAGKKSLAVSFILQDERKTLTDSLIERTMQRLIDAFTRDLGAQLR